MSAAHKFVKTRKLRHIACQLQLVAMYKMKKDHGRCRKKPS
jgi:hypothetical protein